MAAKTRQAKQRKTAFVPRVVFTTALVGAAAIPICVTACSGQVISSGAQDSGVQFNGDVAAVAFDSGGAQDSGAQFNADVATVAFDVRAGDAGFGVADVMFSVAEIGFDAEAGSNADDAPFGVAADAFSGG